MNQIKLRSKVDFNDEFDLALVTSEDGYGLTSAVFSCTKTDEKTYKVTLYPSLDIEGKQVYYLNQTPIWTTTFYAIDEKIKRKTLSDMLDVLLVDDLENPKSMYENFGGELNGLVKPTRQVGIC